MSDAAWDSLDGELAHWRERGLVATLWWRDDDASAPSPALDRLLALSRRFRIPLALAVIPATLEDTLPPLLTRGDEVTVLQHGFAHSDYAARDEPAAELGEHRPADVVLDELARGREVLDSELGERFIPVLVPPWNRITEGLVPSLARLGFRGLSCFSPRPAARVAGLACSNCHVDPVNWRGGGSFRGEAKTLAALVEHLRARREGAADPGEPTGLLTHHWRHDGELWRFLERLFSRLQGRGDVRWDGARRVFGT